jgi:hypothetical protein
MFATERRRRERRVREFYRLIHIGYRNYAGLSILAWAGLILMILLFAANHENGWMSR